MPEEAHYQIHGARDGDAPSWAYAIEEAWLRGLDTSQPFRACGHRSMGYIEFWQTPTPTPNDMLREAGLLEPAKAVA